MIEPISPRDTAASRPALTLMMVLCGLSGALPVAGVDAAPADEALPRVVVHYQPASLATEAGTKTLYHRIVNAAERACPTPAGGPFVPEAIRDCRDQAVARAVQQIGNPALAALHAGNAKRG